MSAIVITWNSEIALPGLLESLGRQTIPVGVVNVDNASRDSSRELIRTWHGPLTVIDNQRNFGFAAALKQAVAATQTDYILMVNPDVRVDEKAVEILLTCLSSNPSIVAAGPRLVREDGMIDPFCARRLPTLAGSLVQSVGLWRLVRNTRLDPYTYRRADYERERDVPCLSGAAMMVRRAGLEFVGGVDDRWFMYYEDVDICARLGTLGRVRYLPDAVAWHAGAQSSPRTFELEMWLALQVDGAVNLFFRVHRGAVAAFVHRAAVLLGALVQLGAAAGLVVRSRSAARRSALRARARLRWAVTGEMPAGEPQDRAPRPSPP